MTRKRSMLQQIEALLAEHEPRIVAAFLAGAQDLRDSVQISALVALLERGDINGAIRALDIDRAAFRALDTELLTAFEAGGAATAGSMPALRDPNMGRIIVRFDTRNARAERAIAEQGARLVSEIARDTEIGLRRVMEDGLRAGQNPRATSIDIAGRLNRATGKREGGLIGLTSRQMEYVARARSELLSGDPAALRNYLGRGRRDKRFDRAIEKAIRDGRPLERATVEKIAGRYSERLVALRAEVISRTETMRALGAAQTEAWHQAIEKGVVQREEIRRYWVTAGDERVRHTHRQIPKMNPEGVGWDEPFQTPTGPVMHAPHPTEPMCRCRERISVDYVGQAVRALRRAA